MAEQGGGEYKIKLVSEADLKGHEALKRADEEALVRVKGLEEANRKAASSQASSMPYSGKPGSNLATGAQGKSREQLISEERETGLETERKMAAEDAARSKRSQDLKIAQAAQREAQTQKIREDARKAQSDEYALNQAKIQQSRTQEEIDRRTRARNNFVNDANKQRARTANPPDSSESKGATDSLSGSVANLATKYLTWYAAWRLVKEGFKETVVAAAEQEQTINKLSTAMVQNGTYSQGYLNQLKALALQMQKTTGVDQGEWLTVLQKLTQFGADSSNIEQYATAVMQLSGIYGSVETAVIAVQKALEGNFQTLTRHGIYIDENATQAEKLKSMLEQVAKIGGGQTQASMEGLAGAWHVGATNAKDFGIQIGTMVSQHTDLESKVRAVSTAFEFWANFLRKTEPAIDAVSKATDRHVHSMREQRDMARELKEEFSKLNSEYHQTVEAMQSMKSAQDALDDAKAGTAEKEKERELAIIRSKVAQGVLTEQQGMIAKAQIQQKFDVIREQAEERKIQRDRKLKEDEFTASMAYEDKLEGKLKEAEAGKTKHSEAQAKKAEADADVVTLQGIQKNLDVAKEKYKKMDPGDPDAVELKADIEQLEWKKKKQEKVVAKSTDAAKDLEIKANNDDKRIEALKDKIEQQHEKSQGLSEESFNADRSAAQIIAEKRRALGIGRQAEDINLRTDINPAQHHPAVYMSPEELNRNLSRSQQQSAIDFVKAIRERDVAAAELAEWTAKGLGASQADIQRMDRTIAELKRIVATQQRAAANRPPQ